MPTHAIPRSAGGSTPTRPATPPPSTGTRSASPIASPRPAIELDADTFILEAGFERLNGVDFRKGCYVGQEVTARMKHKTELRKGFVTVALDGPAAPGTPVLTEDGKEAGRLTPSRATRPSPTCGSTAPRGR